MERLHKIIADRGYCSRRKAEELMVEGRVSVNGKVITELGTKVSPKAVIRIDGKIIGTEDYEYVLLYKPEGYISATKDSKGRKVVNDLIETDNRLYPVGRLDYDTSGLILLTNDGELTNGLLQPNSEIPKTYTAKVKGILFPDMLNKLRYGVEIDGYKTKKAYVKVDKYIKKSNNSIVTITIREGKNRQIRKMFESVGSEVTKLKRESLAFLDLKGLKIGEYRHLTIKEVKRLYGIVNS